jgi:helicase
MKITDFTEGGEDGEKARGRGETEGAVLEPRRRLEELPVPARLAKNLRGMGYEGLLDHQLQAYSLFTGIPVPEDLALEEYELSRSGGEARHALTDRLMLSFNTSAGKTVLAILFMDRELRSCGGQGVYCVPYKALADEIAAKLRRAYLGIWDVGISTGDYASSGPAELGRHDILVATYDKLDSLLRKDPEGDLSSSFACVALDEFHLVGTDRGPVIEDVVIKLKRGDASLIALSATVGNRRELQEWLSREGRECFVAHSDFRPVELRRGVFVHCSDSYIHYEDGEMVGVKRLDDNAYVNAAAHFLEGGESTIFFRQSRSNAKSTAERVAEWRGIGKGEARTEFSSTGHGESLAELTASGCAYHHAGLSPGDRDAVESLYRSREIDFLACTTTLSTGINLPAAAGLVEFMRYDPERRRMAPVPKNECLQCLGRIGRPQYDSEGVALLLLNGDGKSYGWIDSTVAELMERYFEGGPDPIRSSYHDQAHLAASALGAVAGGYASTVDELRDYAGESLAARQSPSLLYSGLELVLDQLSGEPGRELLREEGGELEVTKTGKIVNSLYIHPATAALLLDALDNLPDETSDLALVFWAALTPNFRTFYLRRSKEKVWRGLLEGRLEDFGLEPGRIGEEKLRALMTATVLVGSERATCAWALESDVREIERRWLVQSGDLQSMVGGRGSAGWVLRAFEVLARSRGRGDLADRCRELEGRLRYGVRRELLPLVRVRGVGRKRGRALYRAGFRSASDLASADPAELARVTVSGRSLGSKWGERLRSAAESEL